MTSLYFDASVLLKMLFPEPESRSVVNRFISEAEIVVSSLARLETLVGLQSRAKGGDISKRRQVALKARLEVVISSPNVSLKACPPEIFQIAEAQLFSGYCPTLDRLHLAAMESLHVRRIFTHDELQAKAAAALGYEVLKP